MLLSSYFVRLRRVARAVSFCCLFGGLLSACAAGGRSPMNPPADAGRRDAPADAGTAPSTDSGTPDPVDAGPPPDAGCVSDTQCGGGRFVCNEVNHTCVEFGDELCSPCSPSGTCGGDAFCYRDSSSDVRYCALPCVRATKCPTGFVCADGPGARRLCVPESGACAGRACDFVHCEAGRHCSEETTSCVDCLGDVHCPAGRCNPATDACVQCLGDGDCPDRCDLTSNTCVECIDDGDCPGRCMLSENRCVACLGDGDCPGGHCDATNTCVECRSHADCPSDRGRCNAVTDRCVQCLRDGDCPGRQLCSANTCVDSSRCTSDSQCPSGVCNIFYGTCDCEPDLSQCMSNEVCCLIFAIPPASVCELRERC